MSLNQKVLWDEEYSIGVKTIDNQHKKLFDLVNALYDLEDGDDVKEKLRKILYDFSDYIKTHFQNEEHYMLSIDFPYLEQHQQIHNDIIKSLSEIIHTPAKLNIIKSKMRIVAKRYLIDHIQQEDIKIKHFIEEKEKVFKISDV
jgi:hemerythrin